jgi:hypothetical protein
LNASVVLMSGLGAPLRTATPTLERASGVRVALSSLPCETSASMPGVLRMVASKTSPFSICARSGTAAPQTTISLCPLAFSNCGAISSIADFKAFELKTLISAAWADMPNASIAANPVVAAVIVLVMAFLLL